MEQQAASQTKGRVRGLTEAEGRELFDKAARFYLGISGEKFQKSPFQVSGRTPAEAVNNFLEPLQRVISCITQAQINVRGGYYATTDEPHALALGDGLPRKLAGDRFSTAQAQALREPWAKPLRVSPSVWYILHSATRVSALFVDNRIFLPVGRGRPLHKRFAEASPERAKTKLASKSAEPMLGPGRSEAKALGEDVRPRLVQRRTS